MILQMIKRTVTFWIVACLQVLTLAPAVLTAMFALGGQEYACSYGGENGYRFLFLIQADWEETYLFRYGYVDSTGSYGWGSRSEAFYSDFGIR